MDEEQPPTVERPGGGDVTIEFLTDIDTGDESLSNQPIFERGLGKHRRFSKGERSAIDQEAANVLSMMGYCKVV